jgi:hypothetical protein
VRVRGIVFVCDFVCVCGVLACACSVFGVFGERRHLHHLTSTQSPSSGDNTPQSARSAVVVVGGM